MNLADLLRQAAQAAGSKQALIPAAEPGAAATYGAFDAEADRVAAFLRRSGISLGDRAALLIGNSVEFAFAYFGILRAGAVAVPINPTYSTREIEAVLADCEPSVLVADGSLTDLDKVRKPPTLVRVATVAGWDELGAPGEERVEPAGGDDDLAVLAYTSGTTGEPRGAMLTHSNLLSSLTQQQSIDSGKVNPDDVVLMTVPLFHIFGLNVVLGLTVRAGATGVLVDRFEPVEALELIARHRVSVLIGAPTMYASLAATPGAELYDLSSVRLAASGAAPLPPGVLTSFESVFGIPISEGYGLTETAPSLTSNKLEGAPRPRSVGKPLPGVELRLVGERGEDVETGDLGEVVVRGPNVFAGYWNRPEDTAAAFTHGWFRTGDVGVLDEEGYLYLVDRKRDLIIVSGFNVFPSEVEAVLTDHPKVAEAAVVGEPHTHTGESVAAYVVPVPGETPSIAELHRHCERQLARFKRPSVIEIVDDLPHLQTGKVLKRALRT
jgi:long-chain acyl-CoA synthetase